MGGPVRAGPGGLRRQGAMKLAIETQVDVVTDETRARVAMVRPILRAVLFSLNGERVARLAGHDKIRLDDLAREYREGSGDCGICFEYAVHEAIERRDALLHPRVSEVIDHFCGIQGEARSILFGAEKGKNLEIFATEPGLLTDESRLLTGVKGQPAKFKRYIDTARRAFSSTQHRELLPRSIRGLWRADQFVGSVSQQKWVATTLKTNPSQLAGAAGIRIGIFPEERRGQSPAFDESRNLVLCPVPYDGGFMEVFYRSFVLVKAFLDADARMPKPVDLPASADRYVVSMLEERRAFHVLDVIDALGKFAQPGLLQSSSTGDPYDLAPTRAVAPVARKTE